MQSKLRQCKDEEKRRELQERVKEYDEVSINVFCTLITICHCIYQFQNLLVLVDTNEAK